MLCLTISRSTCSDAVIIAIELYMRQVYVHSMN